MYAWMFGAIYYEILQTGRKRNFIGFIGKRGVKRNSNPLSLHQRRRTQLLPLGKDM
jgi:hypothetical protein